ncbi:MAG: branched-chain amino acid ABC transporter permease [Lachnospiraceae bacterium]|jgi:branched-chain amino acid transport system permease protein|nr:branched-chain amino acid ABC transporter permease [Lachnospiraceae bacterium]
MKKKIKKSTVSSFVNYGIVIVLYTIFQILSSTGSLTRQVSGLLIPVCAYIVMALSLNLVVGISGELSLGHAGFMSIGAFSGVIVSAMLQNSVTAGPLRLFIAIVVGAVFAALAGFLIGIPVLRLKGDYLAIVTLAFGEIIKNVINCIYVGVDASGLHIGFESIDALKMDETGKTIIDGPIGAAGIKTISTFLAGAILILVALFIIQNLVRSRTGRAIMAIRDNRIAAEACGLSVVKYKLTAFVISASIAGAAGALYALNYSTVVAKKFDFNTSILILVFVVLGGIGSLRGSMIAAAVLVVLPEMLRAFSDYRMLVYAIVLVLVMILTNNQNAKTIFRNIKLKFSRKGDI